MRRLRCLLGRDLALNWNDLGAALRPVMFFALVAVSFPLGLGADPALLRAVAPGLVWVSALLAVLLALDGLFREDAMDGTLEQWLLSDLPLSITVLARLLAQWISHVAPVVLMGPVLGAALGLPLSSCGVLFVTLLIGTPTVLLIGALGSALLAPARSGSGLLGLLVLPLFVPILVFGAGTTMAHVGGAEVTAQLALLGGFLVLALSLLPAGIAVALRIVTGG